MSNAEVLTKTAAQSRTEQAHLLMPMDLNGAGNLFGGTLLSWIDVTAGIVGLRHAGTDVVTVAIDNLSFKEPANNEDIVTLIGEVTYTGNTSMEVRVDTFKEGRDGVKSHINRAYLIMVALDEVTHRPTKIPQLVLETEEQKIEWEAATLRAALRKKRREEEY